MKKLILSLALVCGFAAISFGQFNAGVGLAFAEGNLGLHAKAKMGFGQEKLRVQGGFTYYLEGDATVYAIDADAHYELATFGEKLRFNPFAGLNLYNVSAGGASNAEIGINLGAAFLYDIEGPFEVFVEPKAIMISDAGGFVITAGIMF